MTRPLVYPAILVAALAVGCASAPAPRALTAPSLVRPPAPASPSLAFTPAVARDVDVDLDRDDRRTVAYAGFESNVESITYTYTDDDQRYDSRGHGRFGGGDDSRYERRSVSASVTVRRQ